MITGGTGALGSSLCGTIVKKFRNQFDEYGAALEKNELLLGYRSEDRLRQTLVQLEHDLEEVSSKERVKDYTFLLRSYHWN